MMARIPRRLLLLVALCLPATVRAQVALDPPTRVEAADPSVAARSASVAATGVSTGYTQIDNPGGQPGDKFGWSVDIREDGRYAVIGAPGDDGTIGYVHLLQRNGNAWTYVRGFSQRSISGNTYRATGNQFGTSVAISGDYLVATPDASASLEGVFIYALSDNSRAVYNLTLSDVTSVDISQDVVIAGQPESASGMLRIISRADNGTWSQTYISSFTSADGVGTNARMGQGVAISGDLAIGGAPGATANGLSNAGRAFVLRKLPDGTWTTLTALEAPVPQQDAQFGWSVAMDGDRVLVGAWHESVGGVANAGVVYAYRCTTSGCTYEGSLAPADRATLGGSEFGWSVAIEGGHALVGVPFDRSVTPQLAGSVYEFAWYEGAWQQAKKITSPDPGTNFRLGYDVALDAGRQLISQYHDDAGQGTDAYVGSVFAGGPSVDVTGTDDHWELVAISGDLSTFGGALGPIWTQGYPGADTGAGTPNVYVYNEAVQGAASEGYRAPTDASDALPLGQGLVTYVFADDEPDAADGQSDIDGGFPKALPLIGDEGSLPFSFPVSYTDTDADPTDDGWNLLGNPLRSSFDWRDVTRERVDPVVYVYTPGAGYQAYNGATGTPAGFDGVIDAGRGFWARATAASPTLTYEGRTALRQAVAPYLSVLVQAGDVSGTATIALVNGDGPGRDANDGVLLAPLAAPYVVVGAVTNASGPAYQIASLAGPGEWTGATEIDLALGATGVEASASVTWSSHLPDGWTAVLVDRQSSQEVTMTPGGAVALDLTEADAQAATGRLAVRIVPAASTDAVGSADARMVVSLLHPNPAATEASLHIAVDVPQSVRVVVYDALGREVAVPYEGLLADAVEIAVPVETLSPGRYVVRATGASFAESRALTVAR